MVKAFQNAVPTFSKGLPDWGVEVLDPMELGDTVKFSIAGLSLDFKDGQLKGLGNIIINAIK